MLHRITQQSVTRSALNSMRRATTALSATQEQLATGRRINRLSDAPLDAARAHRVRAHRSKLEQHVRNLDQAQGEIDFTASVLQDVSDLFIEARDICLRAANATTVSEGRESLAGAVDQLLETLVLRANAHFNGRYVFAGTANDAPPYTATRSGREITAVTYEGNGDHVELDVGPTTRVTTAEPGTLALGGTEAIDVLVELRDLLRNRDGLSESELAQALSAHLDPIGQAHDNVIDATARMGWRSRQVEFTRTVLDNASLADTRVISRLEDTDFAEAAALLFRQEATVQTALMISARMVQNTLLDYL